MTRVDTESTAPARPLRWFFVCVAAILIAIVAVGFAPSFYLRSLGKPRGRLPSYLIFHGIALTSWYLLFLLQAWMTATGRAKLHRTLGIAGVLLAAAVFSLSLLVVLRAPARDIAAGATVPQISLMVIGDLAILLNFAALITLAVLNRTRPDTHKRLMTLASVSLVAPAIARWPGAEATLPLSVMVPQLSFCAALLVYDLATRRRVHPATGWGVASYLLFVGSSVPLALSELGHRFVAALE